MYADGNDTSWEEAGRSVERLEADLGISLHDNPVHQVDQWSSHVRDLFAKLDVDLGSREQVKAAFAGAYVAASLLTADGPVSYQGVQWVCHMLRWLHDRGEEDETWFDPTTF